MHTTTRIQSAMRFTIARITDLALDVAMQGRHDTAINVSGRHLVYSLNTAPVGSVFTDPAARSFHTYIGHPEAADGLREMLVHLEALLAEGPADNQEGQPS